MSTVKKDDPPLYLSLETILKKNRNTGCVAKINFEIPWHKIMAQEVEETMKRIQSHKGVVGTIVVNAEGIPIKSTLDNTTTVQYAGLISQLSDKARSVVRDLDPTNDLTFLRIRSKKHEIMVAPDKEFILIVVQNPVD
ncbi:dynein light chain roadblock-type 2 isoform X1 [Harpegnathos saltator]|nr:dynein light chain roadblock-type 2 isoform X1 [Harpegnathos saltator]